MPGAFARNSARQGAAKEKGSVLVIVLAVMAVGIGLSFYVTGAAKDIVRSALALEDKLKAKLEAESQLEVIRFLLSTNLFQASRVPITGPSFDPDLPESLSLLGEEMHWQHSAISLRDTASMLPVPWCDPALLQKFLLAGGVPHGKAVRAADSWRDWLDGDDFKHLNGAERFDYRQQGISAWTPRNSMAMQAEEEAGLVAGLQQPELWRRIVGDLVWTVRGGSNINTASEPMLQALLDISREEAAQLAERRQARGRLTEVDLLQITGKNVGPVGGTISEFPNFIVAVQIRTSVGEAMDQIDAVLDLLPREGTPGTLLRYEQ